MGTNDQSDLEKPGEKEMMQREGVNAHIEGVTQEFSRQDSWQTFKADEIAEASFQDAINKTNAYDGDHQTYRFQQFLAIATNLSSLPFAEKLHKIPELVGSIKRLLEDMMKELKEYSHVANELRDVIQCFVRMVAQAKHNVNMMLPLLTAATAQMTVVQDVMTTDPIQKLNDVDKHDIELALERMSSGIQNLLSLAKASTAESQKLDDRIHNMTNSVQSKKFVVEERLAIANFCFKHALPAGSISSGATVVGLVTAEAFGGFGTLVIAGTAFPPIKAIIAAFLLGGMCCETVSLLVKKFWARHQLKALEYLEKIFEGLVELKSANTKFMCCMADAEEKANAVSQHIQDIQLCLESERQRRTNHDVCTVAMQSTRAMIESLKQISNLDMSIWTDNPNMIAFSKTQIVRNAIKN